ncbi:MULTISPECIES: Vms1/Ankzf1 family peptidyl-tRNA hydrolase [Streptomyces]|uniref:baeRF2 domain-containing protein n=2 Tax=Streptomyces TaxID=1883 RepID=UPI001F433482|nr:MULTISPECIES: Vms1/Ankzf1 family peptidyl-tRNA hydrolase [Streptomyces]
MNLRKGGRAAVPGPTMDLAFLQPLYEGDAPVVSVHLDTSRVAHDADKQIELRWRAARRSLSEQGAEEADLSVLDEVAGGAPELPGPQGEALFASAGRLLGAFSLAEPPAADSARVLPVPDALGVAIDRDHQLPHVVVAVDREGADVEAYPAAGQEPASRRTFNGSTLHITRVRGGAEAQASYHRRSANLWAENTGQAADDVRAAAADVGAALVLIAGDPRAVGLLREHLGARPPEGDAEVVYVEGGRTDASARESLRAAVDSAMREAMARRHQDVLERLAGELAGGRALQGIPAVKEALAEGRVETLLMAADRSADPLLFASRRDPRVLGTEPAALGEDPTAFSAPAAPLLLRSAVLGGASFTEILPPVRCTDGVAALLRY